MIFFVCVFIYLLFYRCDGHATIFIFNLNSFHVHVLTYIVLPSSPFFVDCCQKNLLEEGYAYVLTAQFPTDPLERQFSKYRQMSGGQFLVGLREATNNERILALKFLLKESISFWQENIGPDSSKDLALLYFNHDLKKHIF